jgi:hypothetical protein
MERIVIRPHKYRQFVLSDEKKCNFYLITDIADSFVIEQDGSYKSCKVLEYGEGDFIETIHQTEEPAHILVICPDHFISSIPPQKLGQRKLAVMAANSAPTSKEAIRHFAGILEATDPYAQRNFANRFFDLVEETNTLQIVDEEYNTSASFNPHADEYYEWFEQGGPLDWSGQQIVPSGELSVLPLAHGEFGSDRRLAIEGEVALKGITIVHSGKPSFLPADQARIYRELLALEEHAVIAKVENGVFTGLKPTHSKVEPALSILEKLFAVDSRYSAVWELGFGINTNLELWNENTAMNEVYGGDSGVVHWGLGLTPFTQYHLDIICPRTKVISDSGEILIGATNKKIKKEGKAKITRKTVAACPCGEY